MTADQRIPNKTLLYYQNMSNNFFENTFQACYIFIFLDFLGKGPQVTERQMNGRGWGWGGLKFSNVLSPGLQQEKL